MGAQGTGGLDWPGGRGGAHLGHGAGRGQAAAAGPCATAGRWRCSCRPGRASQPASQPCAAGRPPPTGDACRPATVTRCRPAGARGQVLGGCSDRGPTSSRAPQDRAESAARLRAAAARRVRGLQPRVARAGRGGAVQAGSGGGRAQRCAGLAQGGARCGGGRVVRVNWGMAGRFAGRGGRACACWQAAALAWTGSCHPAARPMPLQLLGGPPTPVLDTPPPNRCCPPCSASAGGVQAGARGGVRPVPPHAARREHPVPGAVTRPARQRRMQSGGSQAAVGRPVCVHWRRWGQPAACRMHSVGDGSVGSLSLRSGV